MIISEQINDKLIKHYSDNENCVLLQVETGKIYEIAIDVIPCKYTYEEIEKED